MVVIATNKVKSKIALRCEINPWEIGLFPKGRQYFVNLSVSTSFLSKLASTMSLRTKPAEQQAKDAQAAAVKAVEAATKTAQTTNTQTTKETTPPKELKEAKPSGYQGGEPENVIPLKSINDESLAIIYVEKESIHILPDESKHFTVNTPPFSNFLVERVLAKMQDKDTELVRMKQLTQDKMLSYNIIREGDLIREIGVIYFEHTLAIFICEYCVSAVSPCSIGVSGL